MKIAARPITEIPSETPRTGLPNHARLPTIAQSPCTRTRTGLEVHAWLDEKDYPPKIKVSDVELEAVNIHRNDFHGEWNYEIRPQS